MPDDDKLVHDKPVGKGWVNLLSSSDDWNFEPAFWQLQNKMLQVAMGKEKSIIIVTQKKDMPILN